jgi:PEP-CTERM motif-containing protein
MRRQIMCAVALWALSTSSLHGAILSMEAVDNATVQPAGPRSGANGKAFFNVEGSNNNAFASYGVADFNYGARPAISDITAATLKLTHSNAAFTAAGTVAISLDTKSPPADIQPVTSPLKFDGGDATPGGDPGTGPDVTAGNLVLDAFSGTFSFPVGMTGDVDSYTLGLTPALKSALISRLQTGSPIRIVIGTGEAGLAATWAGFSNSTLAGPTLELTVVPEPASLLLVLIGAAGLWLRQRAK